MVALSEIKAFNATLKGSTKDIVAVVIGGTNGIGKAFMMELASKVSTPKIYFIGRNQTVLDEIKSQLRALNAEGTYVPVQADDLSLLSNVDATSKKVLEQESKIDLLFQSQGYLTFASRNESVEGLDKITAIRYYGRMRFVVNLLPLLKAAPSPRVISILTGGLEGKIFPDDLHLKDPQNYGVINAANVSATYTTIAMEELQTWNQKIAFVHMYPGFVRTNLMNTEHFGALTKFFINRIIFPTIGHFGATAEEAGSRALYAATNPRFASAVSESEGKAVGSNGVVGSGVYTLNAKDDSQHHDKILLPLREKGLNKKIWEHTEEQYQRILGI